MSLKTNLLGLSAGELRDLSASFAQPEYRGDQLYHALYIERKSDLDAITNLPFALRRALNESHTVALPTILRRYLSTDRSVRYLLRLGPNSVQPNETPDPETPASTAIETVFMPEKSRQTICLSTQAGCAVDCHFCLTATLGLIRNLTAAEILGQILVPFREHREELQPQTNIVLMGQGEPLLNYEPVLAALRIMMDPKALAISPKHITLSTSGIIPGIERLALEPVRPKLAISLNASNDDQRDAIMPLNRKYPLAALLATCRRYPLRPWEHLTFEYVLLGGFNDSEDDARRVARLLAGLRAKINLIPWNPGDLPYDRPDPAKIDKFQRILLDKNYPAFIRYSRGQDVMAACGQLALLESPAAPLHQIASADPPATSA
jgi:23S rRNA (adenine2503-C2)-methyltransferase